MINKLTICFSRIAKCYLKLCSFASEYLFSILVLLMRIWIGKVFWYSGLAKFSDIKGALFLFKNEYKVPLLNPEVATYLAMVTELTMPCLIITGLGSRLASLPLLVMTAVIQFTYFNSVEHLYWSFLLGIVVLYGPGKISLDHLIYRQVYRCSLISPHERHP